MAISLRPAIIADRERIYRWLARSDATPAMMGPPVFPDHPVPTYAEFCEDYDETAYSSTEDFRLFVIRSGDREIGAISYFLKGSAAEIDIWIGSKGDWGHGYGRQTIEIVVEILRGMQCVDAMILRPSARNTRAIKAYMNASFRRYDPEWIELPDWCLHENLDYEDAIVLARKS